MRNETIKQVIMFCLLALLVACDGPAEQAGKELDDTIRDQREKIEEAERQIAESKSEIEELRGELQQAQQERQRAEGELSELRQERQKILADLEKLTGQKQNDTQQTENRPSQPAGPQTPVQQEEGDREAGQMNRTPQTDQQGSAQPPNDGSIRQQESSSSTPQ